jgi:hypothetical protein
MARVMRQVDVILQNHTAELLTLESAMAVQGQWDPLTVPKIGSVIVKQGAAKWTSQSTAEGVPTQGVIRLGSTKGYIAINWLLPRQADNYAYSIVTPPGIDYVPPPEDLGQNLDFRVLLITLVPTPIQAEPRRPSPDAGRPRRKTSA